MPRGRPKQRPLTGPGALADLDVEVRTSGGGTLRGRLAGVEEAWLTLTRHRDGRVVLVPLQAVAFVSDESKPVPRDVLLREENT